MTALSDHWILRRHARPDAAFRLFCFPYAGAGTAVFSTWPERLSPALEVCAVKLPGRESRRGEPPVEQLTELTGQISGGLGPWLDMPFAFYGHSFGALLALETARRLRDEDRPQPSRLFVAARAAPQLPPVDSPFHSLDDREFVQRIARRYGGIPQPILAEPALMRQFLPTLRADFTAMETYVHQPEPPLSAPITALGGRGDILEEEHLRPWQAHTETEFVLYRLPGGHFFLQSDQGALFEILEKDLGVRSAAR